MKKRLLATFLAMAFLFTSFSEVQAESFGKDKRAVDIAFEHLSDKDLEQGVYNPELNRMEYTIESAFNEVATAFANSDTIKILRTVYAYYTKDNKNHRVEVIHVKQQEKEKWEETVRTYLEPHSFGEKVYTSDYYKSGDYGYYPYEYVCSKCKYRKKGGVDKIYIGPGSEMPAPTNFNKDFNKSVK